MKNPTRTFIITGGVLNLLLALFHVFLCLKIYQIFGKTDFYPLMQMLAIGGTIFIFFLAYTSLVSPGSLISTSLGAPVIGLNILLYLSRALGELILFPKPKPIIIAVCLIQVLIYGYVFLKRQRQS